MNVELAGAVILNESHNVLVCGYDVPTSDRGDVCYELPIVMLDEPVLRRSTLKQALPLKYGIEIAIDKSCGDVAYEDETSFYGLCHLFRAHLLDWPSVETQRWNYIDLHSFNVGRHSLGPYTQLLHEKLKREEIRI